MLLLLISYLILLVFNRDICINTTKDISILWFNLIFASMFIPLIIASLIIKRRNRLLDLYLLSFFIGNPFIAKILNDTALDKFKKGIIIGCTSYFNPLFLMSILDIKYVIAYYLSSIFMMIIFYKDYKININLKTNSIIGSFNILVNILAVMIICSIMINIIYKIVPNILYIHPFLEITSGIRNISDNKLLSLLAFIFCGISIHIQNGMATSFNYLIYLIIRIFIAIFAIFILKLKAYGILIFSIILICSIILKVLRKC